MRSWAEACWGYTDMSWRCYKKFEKKRAWYRSYSPRTRWWYRRSGYRSKYRSLVSESEFHHCCDIFCPPSTFSNSNHFKPSVSHQQQHSATSPMPIPVLSRLEWSASASSAFSDLTHQCTSSSGHLYFIAKLSLYGAYIWSIGLVYCVTCKTLDFNHDRWVHFSAVIPSSPLWCYSLSYPATPCSL